MRFYALDIETEGLDPLEQKIVSIAVAGETDSIVLDGKNELALLEDIAAWFTNPHRETGCIVTWNGSAFDWPYMETRAKICGATNFLAALKMTLSPQRPPVYKPTNGHLGGYVVQFAGFDHADVMFPWRPWAKQMGIGGGLKPVAKANGLTVIEVDRTKITELSRTELVAYNMSDVDATLTLALKLGDEIEKWYDSALLSTGS
jgi:uncharacterized protein YprB with RNaseH-like and TPR domain